MDFMEQAITEVQRGGEQYYEAELYRIKGEILLKARRKDEEEAEECFLQSIKIARRQKAKSLAAAGEKERSKEITAEDI